MKQLFFLTTALLICVGASAQGFEQQFGPGFISEAFRVIGVTFLTYLVGSLFLAFVKMILDYRLKNKVVDKGTSEAVISQLLQTNQQSARFNALKWAVILGSVGIGLLLVAQFPPFGMHSLVIITFCIAGAFLAYYFLLKRSGN
jgi:hypothetical protein